MALNVSVNKLFNEEATIIVWRNINKFKFIPTGHFGHAAIMLRGASLMIGNGDYRYISWWPDDTSNKRDARLQQVGFAEEDYHNDMSDEMAGSAVMNLENGTYGPRPNQLESNGGWGTASDAQISVPGISPHINSLHTFGLCLNRMYFWWGEYQDNNGRYQLASKKQSCAGVALVAMIEGGSNGFADAPSIKIYAEPKQVEAYARTLQRAILDFNKRVTQFDLQAKKAMEQALSDQRFSPGSGLMVGVTGFQTATELWSIEDWKRQSNIPNAMRSLLVRKIDSSLQKYHKADLESDFANKYKYLIQVMDNVMKHRAQKPDSKRSFAMNRLGMQAIEVTRSFA